MVVMHKGRVSSSLSVKGKRGHCASMSLRPRAQVSSHAPLPSVGRADLPGRLHRVLSIGQTYRLNGPTPAPTTTVTTVAVAQPVQAAVLPNELPLGGCCDLDYDSDSSNASYEAGEVDEVGAGLALDQLGGVEVGTRRMAKKLVRSVKKKTGMTTEKKAAVRKERYKEDKTRRAQSQGGSLAKILKEKGEDGLYVNHTQMLEDYNQLTDLNAYDALILSHKLLVHRFAGRVKEEGITLENFLTKMRSETGSKKNPSVAVLQLAQQISNIMADTSAADKPLTLEAAQNLYGFYWPHFDNDKFRTDLAKKVGVEDWSKVLEPLLRQATSDLPSE